jgi:hypothetical protein
MLPLRIVVVLHAQISKASRRQVETGIVVETADWLLCGSEYPIPIFLIIRSHVFPLSVARLTSIDDMNPSVFKK